MTAGDGPGSNVYGDGWSIAGRRIPLWSAVFTLMLAVTAPAEAQEQISPILQVDTGGHQDRVRGLAYSRDGLRLYSAGFDKAVRVWDLSRGITQKTLRGQINAAEAGNIYALAVSPDESVVAVGGYMASVCPSEHCGAIRLFDPRLGSSNADDATGRITGMLTGHSNIVLALAFSPDGQRLASAGADRTVRIWNMATRKETARFATNKNGRSEKLTWTADGAFVVVAAATKNLEIFAVAGSPPVATLAADETLHAVAASEDGGYVAAASSSGAIHVWHWPRAERALHIPGNGAQISVLTFGRGPSAGLVVSGPATATDDGRYASRIVDIATASVSEFTFHDNVVTAITISADGREVATSGGTGNAVHLWSPLNPRPGRTLKGTARTVWAAGFMREMPEEHDPPRARTYLAWGFSDPCPGLASCPERLGTLEFALPIPTASGGGLGKPVPLPLPSTGARVVVRQALAVHGGARLTRGASAAVARRFPALFVSDGDTTASATRDRGRGDDHLAYSFDPSGKSIASAGRNGTLEIFDRNLALLRKLPEYSGDIFSLAYDDSGRLLATGGGDNTLRLWNPDTGELIVSLLHTTDNEWVVWTPQGYFDASPGGERLVGWQINRGPDKAADHVTGDQVRTHFYKPDVVERAIALASARTAIDEARKSGRVSDFTLDHLRDRPSPKFQIIDPPGQGRRTKATSRSTSVAIAWPPDRLKAESYDISVNAERLRPEDVTSAPFAYGELLGLRFDGIRLAPGVNTIKIVAVTDGVSHTETVEVELDDDGRTEERETLYVVAIGVDLYPNLKGCKDAPDSDCGLKYAGRDATEFVRTVSERMVGPGKGHQRIEKRLLVNGGGADQQPTRQNILTALDVLAKAGPGDTAILFVAGHGMNDGEYKFLPTDANRRSSAWDPRTVMPWRDLQGALERAGGRRLLFVDTCRSVRGEDTRVKSVGNDGLSRDIVVYASTDGEQDAIEFDDLEHGAFTDAIIKGIEGKGDIYPVDKRISLNELGTYLEGAVSEKTGFKQVPHHNIPKAIKSYHLVRL